MSDTIYALSSGSLPSGVAIVRVSGPQVGFVVETICENPDNKKSLFVSSVRDPATGNLIDEALILRFFAPKSFTGEDVVEFHLHGGLAVVKALLTILSRIDGVRSAQAGEFTYRAFENGKIDLTRAEAVGDLINSETETQRELAMEHVSGSAGEVYVDWAQRLVTARGFIEAEIDFVDEDDVPGSVSDQVWEDMAQLACEIEKHLDQYGVAKIIRSGFRVALVGRPNAGKSSLLNYLAGQEIAIVTSQPGTTRDVLEVKIDLDGFAVILYDTAGIRDTSEAVELEGIRRAKKVAEDADFVIWLIDGSEDVALPSSIEHDLQVYTKSDIGKANISDSDISISSKTGEGIAGLLKSIRNRIDSAFLEGGYNRGTDFVVARERQRTLLVEAYDKIRDAVDGVDWPLEIRAEALRNAGHSLGMITGQSDVEDLLGVVFSKFCVGK